MNNQFIEDKDNKKNLVDEHDEYNLVDEDNKDILEKLGISVFPEDRKYWFVRTQGGKYYNTFDKEGFIGIEWDEVSDLELINKRDEDVLKEEIVHFYPKLEKPGYVVNQILKFAHDMKKGDIVLIPSEHSSWINIGEIQSDDMYIYDEDEEFEDLLESLDEDDSEKKQILKKRRKVEWIKSIKKSDLDPSLYSIIYSHVAIADVNKYSDFIDRTISQFYIKGNEASFTYKVNKKRNIPYSDMRAFLRANDNVFDYLNKNIEEFDIDDLIFKINVQSKGPIQFKGRISTVLIAGLVIAALFGADINFEGLGFKFNIKSEGLPKLIQVTSEIIDVNDANNEEIGKLKEDINKSGEKLEVTTPELGTLIKDDNSIDEDNAQNTENETLDSIEG